MELVLMRHGKAEPRTDAKADFERELTSIGRKKVKQAARGLAQCLYSGRDIMIWSSPLLRAVQTAEIIRGAFGKKAKIQVVDSVANGKWADLHAEWSKIPSPDVLILVGHEPLLSEWTEKISDAVFTYRPASAAAVLLENSELTNGSLAWFMRAGTLARLCPLAGAQRR